MEIHVYIYMLELSIVSGKLKVQVLPETSVALYYL